MCANFSKVSEVVRELFESAVVVRELFGIILTSVIPKVGAQPQHFRKVRAQLGVSSQLEARFG